MSVSVFPEEISIWVGKLSKEDHPWTSLVAQWLRIRLSMQETWVRALVQEDPTCCGATKHMCQNYWACTLEPTSHNYWTHAPQLLKPPCLEPVLRKERSHQNEEPSHRNEEQPPLAATRESPCAATKTQCRPKKKKKKRSPSTMQVGIIQSTESLNRTKRLRKGKFALFLSWDLHLLLPWDIGAPGFWAFGVGLGLNHWFPGPPSLHMVDNGTSQPL